MISRLEAKRGKFDDRRRRRHFRGSQKICKKCSVPYLRIFRVLSPDLNGSCESFRHPQKKARAKKYVARQATPFHSGAKSSGSCDELGDDATD